MLIPSLHFFLQLLFLGLNILFPLLIIFMIISFIKGAPYVPTHKGKIKEIVKLSGVKKGLKTVDLGSGDGRLVMAMAREGVQAHGYEINPFLVLLSRLLIARNGLSDKAFIHWGTFWRTDLSSFDSVTVYGINYIMKDLEKKLKKELKPGTRVISNIFTFPSWQPKKTVEGIYLYIV